MKTYNLSFKISLMLFIVSMLIFIPLTTYQYFVNLKIMNNEFNREIDNEMISVSNILAEPVYFLNKDMIEKTVSSLMKDKKNNKIVIEDENKEVVYTIEAEKSNKKIEPIIRTKELIYNKAKIGDIKISFSNEEINKKMFDFIIFIIIQNLMIVIVLIIALNISINKMVINILQKVSLSSCDLAKGDLTIRFEDKNRDEIGEMNKNLNQFLEKLKIIISEINDYSGRVASGTTELSATMNQISGSIDNLGDSSNTTAAAIEELSSTTLTVANNIDILLESSEQTLKLANNGGNAVKTTIREIYKIKETAEIGTKNVKDLGVKTSEIGEIVTVINDIAAQTNLLALNAAIEAARAGEAGRGFEVVAEEVRKLAEKTTQSTKEISRMVKEIQGETKSVIIKMEEVNAEVDEGIETANNTGKALEEIVFQTENLRDMVNMISNSTKEQSVATEEIAIQTDKARNNVKENGKAIEQSTRAIRDISEIAEKMHQIVNQFKIEEENSGKGIRKR